MKKTTTPVIDDPFFQNEDFQEAINAFAETRKLKRAPLTEYALKLIVKKLHSLTNDDVNKAILIVQQSIELGYQGVFPLKEEQSFTQEMTRKRTEV